MLDTVRIRAGVHRGCVEAGVAMSKELMNKTK